MNNRNWKEFSKNKFRLLLHFVFGHVAKYLLGAYSFSCGLYNFLHKQKSKKRKNISE